MATEAELGYQPPTLEVAEDYVPPAPPAGHLLHDIGLLSLSIVLIIVVGSFPQLIIPLVIAYIGLWVFVGIPKRIAWRLEKLKPPPQNPPIDPAKVMHYTIRLQRNTEADVHIWHHFLEQLLLEVSRITLRIEATKSGIVWQLLDVRGTIDSDFVVRSVKAHFPQATVETNTYHQPEFKRPIYRTITKWKFGTIFPAPLPLVDEIKDFDPLIPLTHAMSDLEEDERVIYTVVVSGKAYSADKIGEKLITQPNIRSTTGATPEIRHEPEPNADEKFTGNIQDHLRRKLSEPLFTVLVMLQIDTGNEKRIDELWSAGTPLRQFTKPRLNFLVPLEEKRVQHINNEDTYWQTDTIGLLNSYLTNATEEWKQFLLVLEPRELAALWHLPHEGYTASSIDWLKGKHVPMPMQMRGKTEGIRLGDNVVSGDKTLPVFMLHKDRSTHMIVIGKPNMGKSTLLHNLVRQDIAAGIGVCVIDPSPQGNLVSDILQRSVAEGRENDVFVWDLRNTDNPPPLNFMLAASEANREDAATLIMSVFEKVYGDDFGFRQMGHTLVMAMQAAMNEEKPTIRDVTKLFLDDAYRAKMTSELDNPAADEFWMHWEKLSKGERETRADPVIRRLQHLYGNRVLYPITCQPNTLNFRDLIRQKRILLICLGVPSNARLTPSDQSLIGSIIVSQIQIAMTAERFEHPFYVYIDEAQHFVTTALPEIFTEARKQNLSLTLANQYLGQLVGDTLQAIEGTLGAMVSFQIGETDANKLDGMMKPEFNAENLMNLEVHQAAVRMYYNEKQMRPFTLETLPDPPKPKNAREREVELRARSIQNYTPMTREEILDWLGKRYPRTGKGNINGEENLSDPI